MVKYALHRERFSGEGIRKVPEITPIFWVLKLLTTAMGEAASDFLVFKYNPYLAVFIGGVVFLITLIIQLRAKKYSPWYYWACVSMVAVFGTMAADGLHIRLHVPYAYSTFFFAATLIIIFVWWHKSQRTLSIHSITNPRREFFYWATVLATFALGTAAGDLAASTMGLGYFTAGWVFVGIIAIPAILFGLFKANEVFCFWFAYIITRPLGASFADWAGKPKSIGGLDYGSGRVAIVLSFVILMGVFYLSKAKSDTKRS